jgi:hypothetical protein
VDVYNIGKKKISNRDLYLKRFEEAWFSWKLKCWIRKLNYLGKNNVEHISSFSIGNIEKVIEIYLTNYQSNFIMYWKNIHDSSCVSKNPLMCRQMCTFNSFYIINVLIIHNRKVFLYLSVVTDGNHKCHKMYF